MDDMTAVEIKYQALSGRLDEATLRVWAATEARSLGRGGVSAVAKATGLSRTTIHAGLAELKAPGLACAGAGDERPRVRAAGGGRKKLTDKDAQLLHDLDALVEPTSRGDPMSPLRWTCKSTYRLAEELKRQGHEVGQRTICDLLSQMNFSLQSTRKTREGGRHEDRDAQFTHIAKTVADYQAAGDPVISVDTKKKGNYSGTLSAADVLVRRSEVGAGGLGR
jgi:transposase